MNGHDRGDAYDLVTASFRAGPVCGIGDYSSELARALRAEGLRVCESYHETASGVRGWLRELRWLVGVMVRRRNAPVLFHYASFLGSIHGVPLTAPLAPWIAKAVGRRCFVIAHELFPPRGEHVKSQALSAMHRLAFRILVSAASGVLVTTYRRYDVVRQLTPNSKPVVLAPVFSNWPRSLPEKRTTLAKILIPGWSHQSIPWSVFTEASRILNTPLLLLGGNPASSRAKDWIDAAQRSGANLEFTGYVSAGDASDLLRDAFVTVLPKATALSTSKGTFAAALRNGATIVAAKTDGPDVGDIDISGAVTWFDGTAADLVTVIEGLRRDSERSRGQRREATALYEAYFAVHRTVAQVRRLIDR